MSKPTFRDAHRDYYDPICRIIAKAIFEYDTGMHVRDIGKYDIDQQLYIAHDDGTEEVIGYLELEYTDIRSGRFVDDFYYSPKEKGISIPNRKGKYLTWQKPCWWMGFSSYMTNYILLKSDFIRKYHRVKWYTPYNNKSKEPFLVVPNELPETKEETAPRPIPPHISSKAIEEVNKRCQIPGKKLLII